MVNFFKCTPKDNTKENNEQLYRFKLQSEIRSLKERFPIGYSFKYLGREMIVIRHYTLSSYPPVKMPAIVTNYSDNLGVIRSLVFSTEEANMLISNKST